MKIRDIPEMGYSAHDKEGARGELLLRGPQIFKEYYKNPEETAKGLMKMVGSTLVMLHVLILKESENY